MCVRGRGTGLEGKIICNSVLNHSVPVPVTSLDRPGHFNLGCALATRPNSGSWSHRHVYLAVCRAVGQQLGDSRSLLLWEIKASVLAAALELGHQRRRRRAQHVVDLLDLIQLVGACKPRNWTGECVYVT
jgi:hypothetical protein